VKVYLGGPIFGCTDEQTFGWRKEARRRIEDAGHEWLDPTEWDYRGSEHDPGVEIKIVARDKHDIERADALLMNCWRPSWGTAMEIMHGFNECKRIVAWSSDHPSPWVRYHATVLTPSLTEAVREACEPLA
jgi:nucleoside 2-deoxyribosyltransferase